MWTTIIFIWTAAALAMFIPSTGLWAVGSFGNNYTQSINGKKGFLLSLISPLVVPVALLGALGYGVFAARRVAGSSRSMLPVGRLFPRGEGVTWLEEMASHLSEVKPDERAAETRKLLLKAAPRQVAIAWIDFLMGRPSRRSVETDVAGAGNAQINNWHPKPRLDPSSLGVLNAHMPAARSQRKEHYELVTTVIASFEEMLAADERKLGADHPNTLVSRSCLAGLYQDAGRTAEAISLLEQTLGDRERVLGADHLDTLRSRYDLARAYQAAGRADEAIPLLERTLADCKRLPHADRPLTKMVRKDLAVLTGKPMRRSGS